MYLPIISYYEFWREKSTVIPLDVGASVLLFAAALENVVHRFSPRDAENAKRTLHGKCLA
jgi:hypothetical protein